MCDLVWSDPDDRYVVCCGFAVVICFVRPLLIRFFCNKDVDGESHRGELVTHSVKILPSNLPISMVFTLSREPISS